ncbi:NAD(P)H-hydrate repair enzyme Nnr [Vibrio halioticoli NBRC 102217]|uniref:Bifunctional NAD(P)H-hydrate repair enzyme n=1 Tax=Vibrio halioticoli NBRC 102217 TaxID=1219072 RepID=V5HIK8_9VIBR|nr:bifunctional ADP-dependent NAD(P)H-hydrate dehydratase/NAD(P)H-hydrate epimerase [Vibrio halioticoli]GAD89170.1 NAD(P)H-hydrate repair enzyme Nnr [Vibrio halioticoli NBRC 102217]
MSINTLYSAEQIKRSEASAAELAGITLYELMERAGQAAFERVQVMLPDLGKILVCCGSGNNGGDGFVVARLALESGYEVDVFQPTYCTSQNPDTQSDAYKAKQKWSLRSQSILNTIESNDRYDLIVDGLLGTGLVNKVRDNLAFDIIRINALNVPILSLDIPSGLQANTGEILGSAIKATETITFVGNKLGLVTGKARNVVGNLYVADLGVSPQFSHLESSHTTIFAKPQAQALIPQREASAHKGNCGRALLVGGNQGMSGAIIMAAQACARTGAGLINVMTHADSIMPLLVRQPEIMSMAITNKNQHAIDELISHSALASSSVIAIGPGLGTDLWSKTLFNWAMAQNKPKIIDADGLNLLASSAEPFELHDCVLTPHPGEAARLLGVTVADIEKDRYAAVNQLQAKFQCVVLLKGAGTLICDGKNTQVITAGNSGMASGGMGDVLTGVIAGLVCQGLHAMQAACLGAWLHSTAADNKAKKEGTIGMLASDLLPEIRTLINQN